MSHDNTTPPGWYPDGQGGHRYWDGSSWTEHQGPANESTPAKKSRKNLVIFGIIGLLVLCCGGGGLVAALSGDDTAGPRVVDESGQAADDSDGDQAIGSKDNPASVGDTVELEGTRYTVEKVETAASVGDEFFEETANGTYVLVTLTIENVKDETKTFFDGAAVLVAGNDKRYNTDTDGSIAAVTGDQEPLIFEDMQPDVAKTGVLVYDIPQDAVAGSLLEVSDLFGRGEAYIDLGLT